MKKKINPFLIIVVLAIVVVTFFWAKQKKDEEDGPVEYVKSSEQKRFEQECIGVNVAWQKEPDTEYQIEEDVIVSYCGCMGNSFFPKGSESAIFPRHSVSYEEGLKGEKDISDVDKTCRIWTFTQKDDEPWSRYGYASQSDYGKLSLSFGDEEYIQEYLKDYINGSKYDYWNRFHDSISVDMSCVIRNAYDGVPPYYAETLFMNGKIASAIRACSNDPHIEDFIDL